MTDLSIPFNRNGIKQPMPIEMPDSERRSLHGTPFSEIYGLLHARETVAVRIDYKQTLFA